MLLVKRTYGVLRGLLASGRTTVKIYREWLGGSETIDTDVEADYVEFVTMTIQDEDAAEELMARINRLGVGQYLYVNESEPWALERYSKAD